MIAVVVVGGGATALFLALSGNETPNGDGDGGGMTASVTVQSGVCDPASGMTPIDVAIQPPDSATVTITDAAGTAVATFTGGGGSQPVEPGDYTWAAEAAGGATISDPSQGSITVAPCEASPDFTLDESELLNHVPGNIRPSCQRVAEDQALPQARASLVCEHAQTTLFYDLWPNTSEMEGYYNRRVDEFGVPRGQGFCDTAQRAENTYVRERGGQTIEIGRLVCFRDGKNAVFIWTDTRAQISVEALREDPDNDQLYRLWARVEFGPLA